MPHVTLITPNALELAVLAGISDDPLAAGRKVARSLRMACLVKGGHLGGDRSVDTLITADGVETTFDAERIAGGEDVHGTGCALSSAIAARLALGDTLVDACRAAKAYVRERIAHAVRVGRGAPAVV
jgi:hydroxymethylpyrimidine kinase/phosphomethylpyrimidine kinase